MEQEEQEDWAPNEEGKEQFSPVSVLDCPFDDEEEEDNGSAFEDHLARVEGTSPFLTCEPNFLLINNVCGFDNSDHTKADAKDQKVREAG